MKLKELEWKLFNTIELPVESPAKPILEHDDDDADDGGKREWRKRATVFVVTHRLGPNFN